MTVSQRRLPAEVYWRRRLFLLAGVIAIVWLVLQVAGGSDVDEPTAKATATTPAPTTAPTPEAKVDGLVDVALVSDAAACDPEKVRITPTVRSGQLTRAAVEIGLVVSSTASKACTLTPADADAIAVISANGTAVWDSTVCKVSPLTDPVAITPGWSTLATVQWTGRGSGSKCTSKEDFASPGKYTVQIGTLGGEPGKATFDLENRPAPKPTATKTTATPKPPKGTTKPADE